MGDDAASHVADTFGVDVPVHLFRERRTRRQLPQIVLRLILPGQVSVGVDGRRCAPLQQVQQGDTGAAAGGEGRGERENLLGQGEAVEGNHDVREHGR